MDDLNEGIFKYINSSEGKCGKIKKRIWWMC